LSLNDERIQYWLGHGAQTTDRVQSLIKEFGKKAVEV
jgi:ribosomal protein S16